MKISYNWLKDYVSFDQNPDELAQLLTDTGLEVEGVEQFSSIKGGLKGFVIGEVMECEKHPDADKLKVTKVNIGGDGLLDIVCGAPNVAVGQKVVVATVGTTIYSGDDSFVIKKAKLRGAPSEGMICAEDEIGIGTGHDGILVLPSDAKVGSLASEYFSVENDVVFEIGLTPNRVDGASHVGAARDIAAFHNMQADSKVCVPAVTAFNPSTKESPVLIQNHVPDLCPRYTGLYITGVKVGPSPSWLQNKLKAIGLNPINNVVDITNFVLHEVGQPMHAFDADKLQGGIQVRKANDGESIITLDGEERKLTSQDLVIADEKEPVAIAGVIGGMQSSVTEQTTNLFLESAYFNATSVRKTAKRQMLSTDSSFRFERGTDPSNVLYALKRAANLLQELTGAQVASKIEESYPLVIEPNQLTLRYVVLDRLIGEAIDRPLVKRILEGLDFRILDETDQQLLLEIPLYRVDVTREADVAEEVLRIYGFNQIHIPVNVRSTITYKKRPNKEDLINQVSEHLSANGFSEIMSNSLTKSNYALDFLKKNKSDLVYVENPLSKELDTMRVSLLFGALESAKYNFNRKNEELKLYEFGNCYQKLDSDVDVPRDQYDQDTRLALLVSGTKAELNWQSEASPLSFFDLKAHVDTILSKLGIRNISAVESEHLLFGQSVSYNLSKKNVAHLGAIDTQILAAFDIPHQVYYAEIYWDVVMELCVRNKPKFEGLPKFPSVRRDLALLLDHNCSYEAIKDIAFKSEKKLLKDVQLFDVYEGKNLPAGKKSYGVAFILQDPEQTLTDKRIDKVMDNLLQQFKKQLQAELR